MHLSEKESLKLDKYYSDIWQAIRIEDMISLSKFYSFFQIYSEKKDETFQLFSYLEQIQDKLYERFLTKFEAFKHFDLSKSKRIGFKEFQFGVFQLLPHLWEEELKQVFNYLDLDGDKKLSLNEFCFIYIGNWGVNVTIDYKQCESPQSGGLMKHVVNNDFNKSYIHERMREHDLLYN